MVNGLWGKKVGMTQIFTENKAVPVTAIDVADWYVTALRTQERNGYDAVQIGCVKTKYADQGFVADWVKKPNQYFNFFREVRLAAPTEGLAVGQPVDISTIVKEGDIVDVAGLTRGRGFAGVVKRHRFGGGRGSHGDKTGRRPGSSGHMRASGEVVKGKRFPGHMGHERRMIRNLEVVKVLPEERVIFIKGAVPGHSGSLLFVRKHA
ncbi:MAG: 50S ribosomal protein L3 [Candidatus Babeliales bacterium]